MWLRIAIIAIAGLAFVLGDIALAEETSWTRLPVTLGGDKPTHDTVVVERGDHLWRISEEHLASIGDSMPVGAYWREVIDTNLPRLRSGDADLIYPGEVIELPPLNAGR
jgi:hypothetical protein